jgi:WXG100 family type VII secretion target
MSSQITIDSEQVMSIASQIDSDNKRLQELLTQSKSTVDGLGSVWTGGAADETRNSYETFAGKFFQTYHDVLDQYVKFLRSNVASQYEQVEQANRQLADAFK